MRIAACRWSPRRPIRSNTIDNVEREYTPRHSPTWLVAGRCATTTLFVPPPNKFAAMQRAGITMVELIVAMGISAILMAMAIPAIQSSRESARRVQCQNNVRQLLVAIQLHHAAEGALPSLYNGSALSYPLREWDLFHMHSWRVMLLPYLELSPTMTKEMLDTMLSGSRLPSMNATVPAMP